MKLRKEKTIMADAGKYTHTVSAETVAAGMSLRPRSNNNSSAVIQYTNRNDPDLNLNHDFLCIRSSKWTRLLKTQIKGIYVV